jgi:hypothetical protein
MLLAMKGYKTKKCDILRTEEEITARIETREALEEPNRKNFVT